MRGHGAIFAINAARLELALNGIDLLAWTQMLLLDGDLAATEPRDSDWGRYPVHLADRLRPGRMRFSAGAGSTPAWCRIFHTVLAATR
jgi:hypothetical protein